MSGTHIDVAMQCPVLSPVLRSMLLCGARCCYAMSGTDMDAGTRFRGAWCSTAARERYKRPPFSATPNTKP
eukprot:3014948-Rhodomonas_salina.3